MMTNMGSIDRVLRAGLGVVFVALAAFSGWPVFATPLAFWAVIAIGAILVLTAVVGFCPIYRLFGISTCKVAP